MIFQNIALYEINKKKVLQLMRLGFNVETIKVWQHEKLSDGICLD